MPGTSDNVRPEGTEESRGGSGHRRRRARGTELPPPRSCAGKRTDGTHCPAPPMRDSEFCFSHDPRPEIVEKRQRARRAGGLASTSARYAESKVDLTTQAGMKAALASVVRRVMLGTMTQRQADVVTRAIRTAMRFDERVRSLQSQQQTVRKVVVEYPPWARKLEGQAEPQQGSSDGAR